MLLLSLLAVAVVSASPEADSVWSALRTRYLGLKTLSGTFDETICSDVQGTCQSFRGKFSIELPNRYRLEVASPQRQTIVSDDTVTWFHFPDENRAVRQDDGQSIPLLAFLEPLLDTASVPSVGLDSTGGVVIGVAVPDSMMGFFDLSLKLGPEGNRIAEFSFTDAWQNTYHFTLSEQRWNPVLAPSTFRFKPPPDTELH